jgi:hypothetical protein
VDFPKLKSRHMPYSPGPKLRNTSSPWPKAYRRIPHSTKRLIELYSLGCARSKAITPLKPSQFQSRTASNPSSNTSRTASVACTKLVQQKRFTTCKCQENYTPPPNSLEQVPLQIVLDANYEKSWNSSRAEPTTIQPEIKKTTTDNIAPHVDCTSCSLVDAKLSRKGGPIDPPRVQRACPTPIKARKFAVSSRKAKRWQINPPGF